MQVESMGEAVVAVGYPNGWGPSNLTGTQLDDVLKELNEQMDQVKADITLLRRRKEAPHIKGTLHVLRAPSTIQTRDRHHINPTLLSRSWMQPAAIVRPSPRLLV